MSYEYSEDALIESATQDVLQELGWDVKTAWAKESFGEHGLLGRDNKGEVVLKRYLLQALQTLNPDLPIAAYQQAIEQITQRRADKSLPRINKEKYELLKEGTLVSYTNTDGQLEKKRLRIFDFDNHENNYFLAVRQLEVVSDSYNRRPDVVCFVNGIPLIVIELKAHHQNIQNAFTENITDYKDAIPHLFYYNAFIILSNGSDAKVGTLTSKYKYFLDWKRINEDDEGIIKMETMYKGTCAKHNLLDIFENFLLFDDSGGEVVKIMAKNHQYIGVNKVINHAANIEDLKGKLGVFWHTQGSGKSYSMVFVSQKMLRKFAGDYTFLIVVDRSELERQIYDTYTGVGAVSSKNVLAKSRDHLRELLKENHRYVFSLIHKFSIDPKVESEYPLITDRKNIIVISDEAHRTQAGTFARNMRFHGLPKASYLGFTGTPIIKDEEELTKNIFGEYVSVYDFKRAIQDGATLPLRYLNRGQKLNIDNPALDAQMIDILQSEDIDEDQKKKLAYLFQKDYVILTAEKRVNDIAKDLVWHFNERGYQGKAMLVALDKPTAVRMYDLIQKYWADYTTDLETQIRHSKDIEEEQVLKRKLAKVTETEVCVIVSSEQNEVEKFRNIELEIAPHRKKMMERDLEKEFKDEENPFRLAIVCAMWITGFDAPCVSTVYLDKPIKSHTLMQTIARANRVYDDEKENGLIVDYGNVYKQLEQAYAVYGESDKGDGKKESGEKPFELLEALAKELKECIRITKGYLGELGFALGDLSNATAKAMEKIANINKAADCVCLNETSRAKFEIMARDVFRKYKALYPEEQVKPFLREFNAIEAIYQKLNQQVKTADVGSIILRLQNIINASVDINVPNDIVSELKNIEIDLSKLDFEKLKAAFAKDPRKNTTVFNLQEAIHTKLQQMLEENPMRLEFYEHYKEIVEQYNKGKNLEDTIAVFNKLTEFIPLLNQEETRAIRENLSQEDLAIFDLLKSGKELPAAELKDVKKVAVDILAKLKAEKLKVATWRESQEGTSSVRKTIKDTLQWLPMHVYSDIEVEEKASVVFQHVFMNYFGGGVSVYSR
jgi:type I restriction enzyme, R subunit